MYESFYGFNLRPFALLPQEEFMFLSRQHRMALDLLVYGLSNRALFCVVSGDIGTGKTTLLRYLLRRRGPQISVGMVTGVNGTFLELLQWTLSEFGLDHRGGDKIAMQQTLVEFAKREEACGRRMVLVVDEAQSLAPEVLEELRLFSNVSAGYAPVLQTVLVGQLGLRKTLRRREMRQFAQRVGVDYVLTPLDKEQTQAYIRHRLGLAGPGQEDLFTPEACDAIFGASRGIPRIVNLLSDTALVYGYADQKQTIDASVVNEVLRDKASEGGWLFNRPTRRRARESSSTEGDSAPSTHSADNG
jgi:type II secretory pathway predicted ATPase ExeA